MRFLLVLLFLYSFISLGQNCPDNCPDDLSGQNQNTNSITVYVYNASGVLIDSIVCNVAGASNNINCDLDSLSASADYLSLDTITGSCTYNVDGNCIGSLPIELISFDVTNISNYNLLGWSTASEINNDYFLIERTVDGHNWFEVTKTNGAGNSESIIKYDFMDGGYRNVVNYYRLTQVDYDGKSETFKTIAIDNRIEVKKLNCVVNLLGQDVNTFERGFLIEIYTDGTTKKIFKE
jgi:hypothetical protein